MQGHNLAKIRRVVAIVAGKGGVGKSTLALNLALFFQRNGFKVGLMDADLYGPSLKRMLPEEVSPSQHLQQHERIIPAESKGIKLMSMAYFMSESNPASVRAPIANGIIKQFIHSVEWGELDFLLIDFPPGTGDIQLTLLQESAISGAIIVTTPQEIALLDVHKATTMLKQMQVPIVGVVENMSYYLTKDEKVYPFGNGGGERFANQNGLFFLGQVPIDPIICQCCDDGKSIFDEAIGSPSANSFADIALRTQEQLNAFEKLTGSHLKNFELQWK
jgi:ATP-binding protein involved in chromosome partitioning